MLTFPASFCRLLPPHPVTSLRFLLLLVIACALMTAGCAMDVSKSVYTWTPEVIPAQGVIDEPVALQVKHRLAPEVVTLWKNWLNTENNINNWKSSIQDAITEDMRRSGMFPGMSNSVTTAPLFILQIESFESKPSNFNMEITMRVLDPMTRKPVLNYRTQKDLGDSMFSFADNLHSFVSHSLAEMREKLLHDFTGQASIGYQAFLSPQKRRARQQQLSQLTAPAPGQTVNPIDRTDKLPPVIELLYPKPTRGIAITLKQNHANIIGVVRDSSEIVSVLVNGSEADLQPLTGGVQFKTKFILREEKISLEIQAVDAYGNVGKANYEISGTRQISQKPQLSHSTSKPNLWVLAVGVSKYQNSSISLKFADQDAKAIAELLKRQEGKMFQEVHSKLLLNEEGTRENVLKGMSRFLGMASYNDLVVIFIAGHGVKDKRTGSYYFVTFDAEPDTLMTHGLLWSTFDEAQKLLSTNVSKVMLWLDTCHAGAMQVGMRGVDAGEELSQSLKSAEGTFVLAASKPGEESIESEHFQFSEESGGHGAFTFALLEGLSGKADADNDRAVSIAELSSFVAKKVPRITNGTQHPYFRMSGNDMPITLH